MLHHENKGAGVLGGEGGFRAPILCSRRACERQVRKVEEVRGQVWGQTEALSEWRLAELKAVL